MVCAVVVVVGGAGWSAVIWAAFLPPWEHSIAVELSEYLFSLEWTSFQITDPSFPTMHLFLWFIIACYPLIIAFSILKRQHSKHSQLQSD